MKRKSILLIVLIMAIGFAAVSTTLYINGNTTINSNKDDFDVYFSDTYVNGTKDLSIIKSDTVIEFTTTFEFLNQEYNLEYEVTNGSKNYDAELVMECTSGNEYLTVINEFDDQTLLESQAKRTGILNIKQTKSYAGEDLDVTIECTINANATERTSLGLSNREEVKVISVDNAGNTIKSKAYDITGEDKEKLLIALDNTGLIDGSITNIIELESNDINGITTSTFSLSEVANVDDQIVFVYFDEDNQEWEFIDVVALTDTGEIVINMESTIPFANVVDNSIKKICNMSPGETWTFAYTKTIEEFEPKCSGIYTLEVWGAQGGTYSGAGGKGGYASGDATLEKGKTVFVVVGGVGASSSTSGYNGGGAGGYFESDGRGAGGGGATHIATSSGLLSALNNDRESVLIVAGGGGGGLRYKNVGYTGGYGGGLTGGVGGRVSGYKAAVAGTQTSGFAFGQGGLTSVVSTCSQGGSGGGYFGGDISCGSAGTGGSGYIGGVQNGTITSGNAAMPTQAGTSTMTGNSGNGYARITFVRIN